MSTPPAMAGTEVASLGAPVIHPSADVAVGATIGAGCRIWNRAQVREGALLGPGCIVGKDAYVDAGVKVGALCKIQNSALIYHGATLEDGVFIGPQACLTNDRNPRAITADGHQKGADDWQVAPILVRYGAAVGACAVVVGGVTIGRFAMVGAGAVVTHDVPDHGLVVGVPARLVGFVCACGHRLDVRDGTGYCPSCGDEINLRTAAD
ncbi:MAG: acyltransferase [Caldilineaceae bacterium]